MCLGMIISSIIALIINTHYTGKIIGLGFFKQMKDLFPILLLSLATGAIVYMTVTYISVAAWLALTLGILEGILIYTVLSKLLRFPEFHELLSIIRRK